MLKFVCKMHAVMIMDVSADLFLVRCYKSYSY